MTGVDRRSDVIRACRELATQVGYTQLTFVQADIATFVPSERVNVIISLHACNTATDDALAKGVEWMADYLFAAPCCQQELYAQIQNDTLTTLLRHGIMKERMAALVTDAARAELLSAVGYPTQLLEFIDLEHSPKNLMLRSRRDLSPQRQSQAWDNYLKLKNTLQIAPKLETLLKSYLP